MKIAVGTDDMKSIKKGHFGDSRHYLVLEVLNASVVAREWRENTHPRDTGEERHQGQTQRIIKQLQDCSLFLGRGFGKGFLEETTSQGIDFIVTDIEEIEQAIKSYLDGQDEGFQYYDKKRKAFIPCLQRSFSKV